MGGRVRCERAGAAGEGMRLRAEGRAGGDAERGGEGGEAERKGGLKGRWGRRHFCCAKLAERAGHGGEYGQRGRFVVFAKNAASARWWGGGGKVRSWRFGGLDGDCRRLGNRDSRAFRLPMDGSGGRTINGNRLGGRKAGSWPNTWCERIGSL